MVLLISLAGPAQTADSSKNIYRNTADRMMVNDSRLTLGGYGEVHYNQPVGGATRSLGTLDVHRVVLLFGYKFNARTQFVTEVEFEHVSEVYIEQAFLQYKISNGISFRGGLLLIPMGIINEYHEPTTFQGVERPLVDKVIAPTTWREIGLGFNGNIFPAYLKYQVYLVNGFAGYDGEANLNGKNGLRGGRQKGAESFISAPNLTGKVEFYGIRGLNVGLSGYFGNTQSNMYKGIEVNDTEGKTRADSSVVGVSMVGVDARYSMKGFELRGQYYLVGLSNTGPYNQFTASEEGPNDLGSRMSGYYLEAGYNVFRLLRGVGTELVPFVRFEQYDTHAAVEDGITWNEGYNNTIITTGLSWRMAPGAVLKADMQFVKPRSADNYSQVFSAGLGFMF
jgi:hypothetical protein